MKIFIIREGNAAYPAAGSEDEFLKMKRGDLYSATITKHRNTGLHNKYWKLLRTIFDNQEVFKRIEHLSDFFKRTTGYCEYYTDQNGDKQISYDSLSFEKMDSFAFEEYYNKCLDLTCSEIIPGLDQEDLIRELEGFNS